MRKYSKTSYAPGYDLFKMVISVLLGSLFVILLLRDPQTQNEIAQQAATQTITETTHEESEVVVSENPQEVAKTTTLIEVTPSPVVQVGDKLSCPARPSRLQVGNTVMVTNWLNLRDAPNLSASILMTSAPGTTMEIIGEPVCSVFGEGPQKGYLWWQVRLPNGQTGWSAEAPINSDGYFLEPSG